MVKCRQGALPQIWSPGEREALRVSGRGPDGENVPEEILGGGSKGTATLH